MSLPDKIKNLEDGADVKIFAEEYIINATVKDHEGETGHGTFYEVNLEGEEGDYYNLAIELANEIVHLNGDGYRVGVVEEIEVLD